MTDLERFPFTLSRPECMFAYCPHHDAKKGDSPCLVGCVSPRGHETGKLDCWCGPKIQELANGNRVIVHRDVAVQGMPQMTDRDTINRVLAEEVMGLQQISDVPGDRQYIDRDGHIVWAFDEWNPVDNIEQAMAVAEKLGEMGYFMKMTSPLYPLHPYIAYFNTHAGISHKADGRTASIAISRAAYEVVKGEK